MCNNIFLNLFMNNEQKSSLSDHHLEIGSTNALQKILFHFYSITLRKLIIGRTFSSVAESENCFTLAIVSVFNCYGQYVFIAFQVNSL